MRALAEADLSGVDGLAFDVDDTLTTRGVLSAEAYAALCSLAEADFRLVAVTGRPLGWADTMAATWPVDAALGENGAGWTWRDGRALRRAYADDEDTRQTQRELLEAVRSDVRDRYPDLREASDQPARRCDLAYDIGEAERVPHERVKQLVSLIHVHGARSTVSSVHAHVVPGHWDKAKGLESAVLDALGAPLDPTRWVFVGDSANDAQAFERFGRTVGVANVRHHLDRLPVPPRWITQAERGAGFVQLARALREARRD